MVFSQIPHMTYQQYRTARRLVHECCNYDCGNCLLLDNSEECVCPQSITYSLICKWFRAAVLPLDAGLLSTPTGKCHFSPGWDVIFWRSACDGYAALITRYLSA